MLWVGAADARKAGSASDTNRRIPRPPALTGKLAWIHGGSETARLVIVQRPLLRMLSDCSRASLPKHEEQLSVCIIFGARNDDFRRVRASCAGSSLDLPVALLSSPHLA